MTPLGAVIAALLGISVLFCWIGAAGLLLCPRALSKLHFTALIGTLGIPAGCLALVLQHGSHNVTVKAVLLAVFSGFTNAVLTQATARAVCISETGADTWMEGVEEKAKELEG